MPPCSFPCVPHAHSGISCDCSTLPALWWVDMGHPAHLPVGKGSRGHCIPCAAAPLVLNDWKSGIQQRSSFPSSWLSVCVCGYPVGVSGLLMKPRMWIVFSCSGNSTAAHAVHSWQWLGERGCWGRTEPSFLLFSFHFHWKSNNQSVSSRRYFYWSLPLRKWNCMIK